MSIVYILYKKANKFLMNLIKPRLITLQMEFTE